MNAPNKCFVPLVAGQYLEKLETTMKTIDTLANDMEKIPYAVFVLGDIEESNFIKGRHHMSPAVVSNTMSCSFSKLSQNPNYAKWHYSQLIQLQSRTSSEK